MPASALAGLVVREDKPGFVVVDMTDVDAFAPIEQVTVPDSPVYLVQAPDRGDEMSNWSPDEALPAITAAARARSPSARGCTGSSSSPRRWSATGAS